MFIADCSALECLLVGTGSGGYDVSVLPIQGANHQVDGTEESDRLDTFGNREQDF